jgi:CheY-like chemotaxis protein
LGFIAPPSSSVVIAAILSGARPETNGVFLCLPVRLSTPAEGGTRIGTFVPVGDNPGMGQRVLIVDDHAGFRASARRMLECEGYEVVGEAENGSEALVAARELKPDLVLVDVGLPDCDGRDLAERLGAESLDAERRLAVLLISSRDDVESGGEALGFIPKDRLSGRAIAELLP